MPPTVGRRGEELGERRMSFTTAPFGSSQFMRKHTQHASFGGEARYNKAKAVVDDEGRVIPETQQASCPVHAYASQDAILSSARDAVVFGTAVRDVLAAARTDASRCTPTARFRAPSRGATRSALATPSASFTRRRRPHARCTRMRR